MRRKSTKGTCQLCGKSFASGGMTRHLQKCGVPEGMAPPAARAGKSARQTFHIRVTDAYSKDYWMHLAVPAEAALYDLHRVSVERSRLVV